MNRIERSIESRNLVKRRQCRHCICGKFRLVDDAWVCASCGNVQGSRPEKVEKCFFDHEQPDITMEHHEFREELSALRGKF